MLNFKYLTNGQAYLIIPKSMLNEQTTNCDSQEGDVEAFLKLLIKVNYSDTEHTDYWNNTFVCKRGESLNSYRSWSKIFHWPTTRTFHFIQQLKKQGIIEFIPHKCRRVLHIRIVDYEEWMLPSALHKASDAKLENSKKSFQIFWDKYHDITQTPKKNIAKAQREWKKLSEREEQLAIDQIEEYYYHVTDTRFILLASKYLENKSFLDEY